MTVSADVSEVHRLAADLQANADQVEPRAEAVIARTGFQVVATGQVLAPFEFGTLRASVGVDIDGLAFEAGPTVDYGLYQELGTSDMSANPFMGPSFDRHLPGAEQQLADVAERILE